MYGNSGGCGLLEFSAVEGIHVPALESVCHRGRVSPTDTMVDPAMAPPTANKAAKAIRCFMPKEIAQVLLLCVALPHECRLFA